MTDSKRVLRIAAIVLFILGLVLLAISFYKQANGGHGAFGSALGAMAMALICYGVGRAQDKRGPPG